MGAAVGSAIAGGVSDIVGGILGYAAANNAAQILAQSANYAGNLQAQTAQQALGLQQQQWLTTQAELAPYLNSGYGALAQLQAGMGLPVTAPSLAGVAPSVPAPLAPQNQPPGASAPAATLASLGLSPTLTAPAMTPGISNVSQAQFNQSYVSAADDVLAAVKAGFITPAQGQAAIQKIASQVSLAGGGGLSGKANATIGQTLSLVNQEGADIAGLGNVTAKPTGTLNSVFIPDSAKGWQAGAPGTGQSIADWAISQAIGSNASPLGTLASTPAVAPQATASAAPSTTPNLASDLNRVSLQAPSNAGTLASTQVPGQVNPAVTNGGIAGTTGSPTQSAAQQQLGTAANITPTSLNQQWNTPFTPPTAQDVANTPGYNFALTQGLQAIERSASAQGNLLTGGTMKDLNNYAQGLASTYYQQAYQNAMNQYLNAYNIFQNNQTGQFNRLSALSGTGQVAANTLGGYGANYANTASSTLLGGAQAQAAAANQAAAATASGYVGGANALGGMAGSLGTTLASLFTSLGQKNQNNNNNQGGGWV